MISLCSEVGVFPLVYELNIDNEIQVVLGRRLLKYCSAWNFSHFKVHVVASSKCSVLLYIRVILCLHKNLDLEPGVYKFYKDPEDVRIVGVR